MWKVECIDCHCHRCHELLVCVVEPPEDAEEHARATHLQQGVPPEGGQE